jgi:hypothetical protein
MIKAAMSIAGPRKPQLDKLLEDYQRAAREFAARPPPVVNRKILFSENFNQGRGAFFGGELVSDGVDGTQALTIPRKSTSIEEKLPQVTTPTWTLRFKVKPLRPLSQLELLIWSGNGGANYRYHARGLNVGQWNQVEVKAAQLNTDWNGRGRNFEGEVAHVLKFYYDDNLPDGTILLDDFEVTQ